MSIETDELVHGAYYTGRCRNATLARWDGVTKRFKHWREKFGSRFIESIPNYGEPDWAYDWFIADHMTAKPTDPEQTIPL